MKLIKTITSTEISETFWREKNRKKDTRLSNSELRNLGEKHIINTFPKEYTIVCRTCEKIAIRKSARAKYCSDACRNKSKERRDNENKAKRNNTRRKGKKGIR